VNPTRPHGPWCSAPVFSRNGVFFWCFRNVVRVRYSFFLVSLLGGAASRRLDTLLAWVVVVFLAILLHELGHAGAARYYRAEPGIELHTLGGVTSWTWPSQPTTRQRVVTSLAGPGIGFFAGGTLLALMTVVPYQELPYLLLVGLSDFIWVTLAWGTFNLLPVLPLDGGGTIEALLQHRLGRAKGHHVARVVSCVVATLAAAAGLALGERWVALLCGLFAYNNLQRLRGLEELRLA
jgi:stage IV sporulation protein FB